MATAWHAEQIKLDDDSSVILRDVIAIVAVTYDHYRFEEVIAVANSKEISDIVIERHGCRNFPKLPRELECCAELYDEDDDGFDVASYGPDTKKRREYDRRREPHIWLKKLKLYTE